MIPTKDKNCLIAKHYSGKRTIFTKKQQKLKSQKRPELRDDSFINGRLKKAIESPNFAYQDLAKPKIRHAVYLEEFRKNNKEKIINVVKNIPAIASKEGWVLTLDKDEGALFYAPKIMPNKTELFQITDEYAIYLDSKF